MKRFVLAALLALSLTVVSGQQASAWCGCKLPWFCICRFGGCGGGGCGHGGCYTGCGYRYFGDCDYGGSGGCGHGGCGGQQGAWYLYWPTDAPATAPQPVAYPYWPTPGFGAAPVYQPASYYPNYWYGHH